MSEFRWRKKRNIVNKYSIDVNIESFSYIAVAKSLKMLRKWDSIRPNSMTKLFALKSLF